MTGFTTNYKNNINGVAYNDIYLDGNGNLAIVKNIVDETLENCYHAILLVKRDYDFDIRKGIPWDIYLQDVDSNINKIKISIYTTLIAVFNVQKVSGITTSTDTVTGILSVNADVQIQGTSYPLTVGGINAI